MITMTWVAMTVAAASVETVSRNTAELRSLGGYYPCQHEAVEVQVLATTQGMIRQCKQEGRDIPDEYRKIEAISIDQITKMRLSGSVGSDLITPLTRGVIPPPLPIQNDARIMMGPAVKGYLKELRSMIENHDKYPEDVRRALPVEVLRKKVNETLDFMKYFGIEDTGARFPPSSKNAECTFPRGIDKTSRDTEADQWKYALLKWPAVRASHASKSSVAPGIRPSPSPGYCPPGRSRVARNCS